MADVADPAIAAARRTLDRWTRDGWNASRDFVAVESAREALAPIRDLHKPYETCDCCDPVPEPLDPECDRLTLCRECGSNWPCATARHVYHQGEICGR